MARLRNVGRQAAGDFDLLSVRDLNAFNATLPLIYIQRNLLNAANGVPQLDANSRMGNAYLPTDISRTTLTSSGKTKAGTLEVTGLSSLAGVSTSGNVSVGGSLSSIGAITGPSVDVGAGVVKGATGDLPEITSETFKAKATTLDSLTVSGNTTLATMNLTGDIAGQAIAGTALSSSGTVVATGEVRGGTVRSLGNLTVEGDWLFAKSSQLSGTNRAAFVVSTNTMYADGGLRIGTGKTISQVDANNNNVPIKVAGGIDVNGPLTNVTSLSTSSALTIGGALTATGKGTFSDLESQSNLKIAGTLTGVSDLTLTGNLQVTGVGKQISATAVSTGTLNATGASTLAATTISGTATITTLNVSGAATFTSAVSIGKGTAAGHALRYDQGYSRVCISYPSAQPVITNSGTYTNTWTPISMDSWDGSYDQAMLMARSGSSHTILAGGAGVYIISGQANFVNRDNAGTKALAITVNGNYVSSADAPSWEGRLNVSWAGILFADDVVELRASHSTGSSLNIEAGPVHCHLAFVRTRAIN